MEHSRDVLGGIRSARLDQPHLRKGLPITPWDLGLGVMFALMAFAGPQAGFVLFGGVVIAEVVVLRHEVEWPVIVGIAANTSLSYTAVTILAIDIGLFHLRDVLMLLAVGALGEMLSVFGYSVKTYESADEFLQRLDQRSVGCVVADVRMPGTDGLGLVRELARRNVPLPVILISSHADVPMAVAAIKSGAEDFIEKMMTPSSLRRSTGRWRGGSSSRVRTSHRMLSAKGSRD
jgi:CheY-like chemotaxis protein